jgi:hypothetical protein
MINKSNLRIYGVEKRPEIQTKGIGKLFNEIIAENFPNLGKDRNPRTGSISKSKYTWPERSSFIS